MNVDDLIRKFELVPHPEGGYFRETYRSRESLSCEALPDRYAGARALCTSIYYLLTADSFSAMHRLKTDEIYHFYVGDPVEMLQLWPDGEGKIVRIGNNFAKDELAQLLVPAGVWQGSRVVRGGSYALIGTTMSPGFDFADFEEGRRADLVEGFPSFAETISSLTRQ